MKENLLIVCDPNYQTSTKTHQPAERRRDVSCTSCTSTYITSGLTLVGMSTTTLTRIALLFMAASSSPCASFSPPLPSSRIRQCRSSCMSSRLDAVVVSRRRRQVLLDSIRTIAASAAAVAIPGLATPHAAFAEEENGVPEVTDRIFLDIKAPTEDQSQRIVIGLYGKVAPTCTKMLLQLVSPSGLPSNCKPRDATRTLQKEQLEANKVYSSCIENESKGVTYEYGTIWRIIKDERIDVGSVSGKFVARQFPNWMEDNGDNTKMLPMEFGSVSVQRGDESGFGFSIYPGKEVMTDAGGAIVIGRVLEGLDVIDKLNDFQVVKSSKVNYMALTGSDGIKKAPRRACSYGSSNLYCNEFKPLQKLSIIASGVL